MKIFTTFFLLLWMSSNAFASDKASEYDRYWPQWRGPKATGVAPHGEPPVEWSESKNIRWKIQVPGKGLATPVIWEKQIFVLTAVETDKKADPERVQQLREELPAWRRNSGHLPSNVLQFQIYSIDRETGERLWTRTVRETVPHEGTHIDGSWASNSPVTDGVTVIAYFGSYGLSAFDMQGDLQWTKDLGDMQTRNDFGEGSSPALYENKLIINWDHEGDSFIVVLDKNTGEEIWRRDRDEVTSWSTPLVVEHDGKPQVIVNATGKVRGYDLETGNVLWESDGMTVNTIPSPVYDDGMVYVTSGFRGSALQAIQLSEASGDITDSDAIAWRYDRDTPYVPSPLLYKNALYFIKVNSGILSCFNATNGERYYGPQRLEDITGIYASPVAADGRVYIVGRNGVSLVLQHGPEYKVLSKNTLDDRFDASPVIVGNDLYLRGRENFYCISEGE